MDRSLDDMIADRQRSGPRGGKREGRFSSGTRDGTRKTSRRDDPKDLDSAWIHDRFEDERPSRRPRDQRDHLDHKVDRYQPSEDRRAGSTAALTKIRIENLHYDLGENDLRELFTRIGPILSLHIVYDRSDRSTGIAYVTYTHLRDAHTAIREFDGANAYGQPIQLTLIPGGPSSARNQLETAARPSANSRSLFDRIDTAGVRSGRERSKRSESPTSDTVGRRSDVRKPVPEHIDRYVPGEESRSRSPPRRGRGGGRRGGNRRDDRGGREREGKRLVQGRPRKTVDELDAEMEDYWGPSVGDDSAEQQLGSTNDAAPAPVASNDDDIDMIE